MQGQGVFAEQIHNLFAVACRKAGLGGARPGLSTASFRVPKAPGTAEQVAFEFGAT
jgi:hypothetical protein